MKSSIVPIDPNINPRDMPAGTKVYAYVRISPGDNQTPESQENAVVKYCQERGWIIMRIFRDLWQSGKSSTREGFDYMAYLARQKPREADMIIFWDFSRFGRSQVDANFYVAEMRMNGWILLSMSDDIPAGPMGKVYEALIFWKNEQFLSDLKLHTIRGLVNIASDGCVPVGMLAKGYRAKVVTRSKILKDGTTGTGRKPEIDPDVAPLVVKAFEMKAQGAPHQAISKATGLFGPASGSWNHLFSSKVYIGEYEFHDRTFTEIYPPIISRELFAAVQKRIIPKQQSKVRIYHPRRIGSSFFLANIAFCRECGAPMEGKSVNGHRYYICSRRNENVELCARSGLIPADDVELEIIRVILNHVVSSDSLQDLLIWTNRLLNSNLDELMLKLEQTRRGFEQASNLSRKLALNFGMMEAPSKTAEQLLHDQEAKANLLECELLEIQTQIKNSRIEVTPEQIQELSTHYQALIGHGEFFDLREVVEKLCARIQMSQEECQIEVHFPVNA